MQSESANLTEYNRFRNNNLEKCLSAFTPDGRDGNLFLIVADARGMSAADMQEAADDTGTARGLHVSTRWSDENFVFRFFVPSYEAEMCGNATVSAL